MLTHVSAQADDWHEYLVKVRRQCLPLVKHASRKGGCVYTDFDFSKRTSPTCKQTLNELLSLATTFEKYNFLAKPFPETSDVTYKRSLSEDAGDTWTTVETKRKRTVRQRVLRLTPVKGGKKGSRSDLRVSLPLEAGSRMRHLRGARKTGPFDWSGFA